MPENFIVASATVQSIAAAAFHLVIQAAAADSIARACHGNLPRHAGGNVGSGKSCAIVCNDLGHSGFNVRTNGILECYRDFLRAVVEIDVGDNGVGPGLGHCFRPAGKIRVADGVELGIKIHNRDA